jgi:hypothetical protein
MNPYPSTALRVALLAEDVGGFDAAGFANHYGAAFLVIYGVAPSGPAPRFRTDIVDIPTTSTIHEAPPLAQLPRTVTHDVEAFAVPIVRRTSSPNDFVSVGRLSGNDIAFADLSVSKLHALIREVEGAFFILDANSRNGTKVNGTAVGKIGGRATKLHSGDVVQLSTVTCTFMDAAAVLALAQRA